MKIYAPYNFRVPKFVPFPKKRMELIRHCVDLGLEAFKVDHFITSQENGCTTIGVVFDNDDDAILFKLSLEE